MEAEMDYDGQQLTRFETVKRVLADFVKGGHDMPGRPNDLLGLITFAGYADTVCPLAHAHDALLSFLKQTDTAKTRNEDGTAIGDGITLAVARLVTASEDLARRNAALKGGTTDQDNPDNSATTPGFEIESKAIILLTDGQNNRGEHSPLEAAQWARDNDITIYTVGIGSDESYRRSQNMFGAFLLPSRSDLDEGLLKQIAETTNGFYSRADNAAALRDIYKRIDELEKSQIETVQYSRYDERFAPLAFTALLMLAAEMILSCTLFRKIP